MTSNNWSQLCSSSQ